MHGTYTMEHNKVRTRVIELRFIAFVPACMYMYSIGHARYISLLLWTWKCTILKMPFGMICRNTH